MKAIKAVYDGTNFMLKQPVPVKGSYEVVITFIAPIQTVSVNPLPQVKTSRSDFIGIFEDKIKMTDDFNEPINDMKEYME